VPKTKEQKLESRNNILISAYRLFTENGYKAVSIDEVMSATGLTRGAFYNHFSSKAELYQEAFRHGASQQPLGRGKAESMTDQQWLELVIDHYLSLEHVLGATPGCPLSFLNADAMVQELPVRKMYGKSFHAVCNWLSSSMADSESQHKAAALTAMLIGAVNVSRALPDEDQKRQLLENCRKMASELITN